jgi:hypothetical protein
MLPEERPGNEARIGLRTDISMSGLTQKMINSLYLVLSEITGAEAE